MTQASPSQHNPALAPLAGWAGDWDMELSHAAFLPDPAATITGRAAFEWVQRGAFLLMRMGGDPPDAQWLISRDQDAPTYTVLYYDARNVSRVYTMSFADGVWKMWRNAPGFSQRFEGHMSQDGKIITAHWEKSTDGLTWEHDFDVVYTKTS